MLVLESFLPLGAPGGCVGTVSLLTVKLVCQTFLLFHGYCLEISSVSLVNFRFVLH